MPRLVDHDIRRAELIAATRTTIAHYGLDGATLRRIADVAGCTTGRITHYFDSRDQLVISALRSCFFDCNERIQLAIRQRIPTREKLRHVIEEALPLDELRLEEWRIWLNFWAAACTTPILADENRKRYQQWRRMVFDLLAEIDDVRERERQTAVILGLIDGLGMQLALNPDPEVERRVLNIMKGQIDRLPLREKIYA